MNIYAPNMGQSSFLSKLNILLAEFADYPILMAGDFNLVSSAVVDRSGRRLPADGNLSSALKELQDSSALTDMWRTVNPAYVNTHFIHLRIFHIQGLIIFYFHNVWSAM